MGWQRSSQDPPGPQRGHIRFHQTSTSSKSWWNHSEGGDTDIFQVLLFCFFLTHKKYFELFSCYYTECAAAVAGFPQDAWCSSGFSFPRSQVLISFSLSLPLSPSQRVLSHQDDTALLKAYIVEWRKFFTQCDILPKPFCQLEITLMGKQGSNKKSNVEDSIVRKVRQSRSRKGGLMTVFPPVLKLIMLRLHASAALPLPSADAGHVEWVHLLQHQEQATRQCHEAGPRRAAGRGLRLTAGHRSAGILRWEGRIGHMTTAQATW